MGMPQSTLNRSRALPAMTGLFLLILTACGGGGGSSPSGASPVSPPPPPPPPPPPVVTVQSDLVYGSNLTQSGAKTLTLDLYQLDGTCDEPVPFVLGIHGGGFTGGSKTGGSWPSNLEAVAMRGYAGLSINYRLVSDEPVVSAEFQPLRDDLLAAADEIGLGDLQRAQANAAVAAFEDAVTALDWVNENADLYCLDRDRFALWGSSAGAYIALHVGHALNDYFIAHPEPLVVVDFWGALFAAEWLDTQGPPIMIVHGSDDLVVPYENALNLSARAEETGLPYSFYTLDNVGHGTNIKQPRPDLGGETIETITIDFIEAHLLGTQPLYEVKRLIQD